MPLAAGSKLGPYEVLSPIGRGGMGEVYRARDTKLKRDVALKVLPRALAGDSDRMARFQREAEVLASLNHPHIAHIYGVEERGLVMELVEGESPKGPMPFDEAWKIALQIADALAYAHGKGVVHRDLKPSNIKVTPDGVVKLLDFGLAKAFSGTPDPIALDPENSPTITTGGTVAGVILGTAPYMSPEQARSKNVDWRTDIWAFGVVLYELLTARKLFQGDDLADTLAKVVRDQPDLGAAPEQAMRVLQACLEKDLKKRLQAIGDAHYLVGDPAAAAGPRAKGPRPWFWPAIAGAFAVAAAALSFVHFRETLPSADVLRFTVTLPDNAVPSFLVLSPDGRRLATVTSVKGNSGLYLRTMDSNDLRLLEGTSGARTPFWSPDSRFLGFFTDGKLKVIPAAGGPATTLCGETGLGYGGTWNRTGVILFGVRNKLRRVNAAGGECTSVDPDDSDFAILPEFLPDGNHFLFVGHKRADPNPPVLFVASLDGTKPRRILNDESSALYSAPASGKGLDYLLFRRGANLMAQPFDRERLEATGDPVAVASPATTSLSPPQVEASVASNGTLTYVTAPFQGFQLTWFDRSGKELGKVGEPAERRGLSLAPDGTRAVLVEGQFPARDPGTFLGMFDLVRNSDNRFTLSGKSGDGTAVWSSDGTRLIYPAADHAQLTLFLRSVDSDRETPLLPADGNPRTVSDWSRDGRFLIYTETDPKTQGDIWYLPDPGKTGSKPVKFFGTNAVDSQGQLSPDGRWLAYFSNEQGPGRGAVYIRSFPSGGSAMKVADKATEPRWSKRGNELFYLAKPLSTSTAALMAVTFQDAGGAAPRIGEAQKLLEFPAYTFVPQFNMFSYSPHPDGKRFLVNVFAAEGKREIEVITNWEKLMSGRRR
jgi:serine/threonine protein kinase